MAASMALLNLSMTYTMATAREREERESNLRLKRSKEDLEQEYVFREQQIAAIKLEFETIKNLILPLEKSETPLNDIYTDMRRELEDFQENLIAEATYAEINDSRPLATAKQLTTTMQTVIDSNTPLAEKNKSAIEFRNHARNAKYSEATKLGIGALIGGAIATALLVGLVGGLIGSGIFALPGFLIALYCLQGFCITALGACTGERIASGFCTGQNDERGAGVSKGLFSLVSARDGLFKQRASEEKTQEIEKEFVPVTPTPGR